MTARSGELFAGVGGLTRAVDEVFGSTRSGGRYKNEMSSLAQHQELAEALLECEATVMLSGYASAGARTEVVWTNREISNVLFHDGDIA